MKAEKTIAYYAKYINDSFFPEKITYIGAYGNDCIQFGVEKNGKLYSVIINKDCFIEECTEIKTKFFYI